MNTIRPDYIFEASWEVCNKMGGIYTVLSTRARTLQQEYGNKLLFIGPDVWQDRRPVDFIPTDDFKAWVDYAGQEEGLLLNVGRWDIPGKPIVILVDFKPFYEHKNQIFGDFWNWYKVDSIHGYGDYDEACMFGYAAGAVVASFYRFFGLENNKVVAHFNEWMTAFGVFYLNHYQPKIATLFTTHATSIGRSIAGNHKPLYDFLEEYDGDLMARELNMEAKHSVEKQAAHVCDCFTTVSDITNEECRQLLDKPADVVTPNGFEDDFVPKDLYFTTARKDARMELRRVAEALLGYKLDDNAMYIATSGRYEYKNKGIDVFVESLKLASQKTLSREIVAFVMVPAWISGAREDLARKLAVRGGEMLPSPYNTHVLMEGEHDAVLKAIDWYHLKNQKKSPVKVIFVPCYLNGYDGIFNANYYKLLIGFDLTVFPSYYEPWGYTPLESAAFSIPTITTDLSGFGQWVSHTQQDICEGVGIIHRSDYNAHEVADAIAQMIVSYANLPEIIQKQIQQKVRGIADKALWHNFIQYYYEAYAFALNKKSQFNQ